MNHQSPRTVAVRCRGVTKRFIAGGTITVALKGIDLEVYAGELLMLVGPSGCGKTTLISVIAGILNQDEGSCEVFGSDLKSMPENARTKYRGANIGFVFQAYNLIPTLTALENASVPLILGGMPRTQAFERARELLKRVGLENRTDSLPSQLSGGQQQRVAIARALVHSPRLVVCDEPTSALDQHTGHTIMDLFKEVAVTSERALIIVTHDARVYSYADRIVTMNDGEIVQAKSEVA